MNNLVVRTCLVPLIVGLLAGCNTGSEVGVTGTVRLDGEPLPNATVVFTPEEGGRPASASTDASGNFELLYTVRAKGAPPGNYIVRIRTSTTITGPDGQDVEVPEKVPPEYNARSEVIREVKQGQRNHFEFDLQSTKK